MAISSTYNTVLPDGVGDGVGVGVGVGVGKPAASSSTFSGILWALASK